MGYSPWGRKELDRTERLHFLSFFISGMCPGHQGRPMHACSTLASGRHD